MGTSMYSNAEDFYKQPATPGGDNVYESPFKVLGVFSMGGNLIGLDFNQAIDSAVAIPNNFEVRNDVGQALTVKNIYSYGPYADLELEEGVTLMDGKIYTVRVGGAVTGGDPVTMELFVMGSNDKEPPQCSSTEVRSSTEIEVFCWDMNGLNTSNLTASVNGGINVLDVADSWDSLVVHLDASTPLQNQQPYTLTLSGLEDNNISGPNVSPDIYLPIMYDQNFGRTDEFFEVVGSSPSEDQWDVPLNLSRLSVEFSKNVDSGTLSVTGDSPTLKLYEFDWNTWDITGEPMTLASVSYSSDTQTATIVNETALNPDTTYELHVIGGETGVRSVYGETMPTRAIRFTAGSENDTTKPKVLETTADIYDDPTSTTVIDPINYPIVENNIRIYFSEAMDSTTLTESTIKMCTYRSGSEYCLDSEVYYDEQGMAGELFFNEALQPATDYTITVTTGVKDVAGNALSSRFTRSLRTGSAVSSPPKFEALECFTDRCTIRFDRGMGSSVSDLANYKLYINNTPTELAGVAASYNDFDKALDLSGLMLPIESTIRFEVNGGITDYMGNPMTKGDFVENKAFNDDFFMNESYWIEGVYPDWGIRNVPTNIVPVVQFSEAMDVESLSDIKLSPIEGWTMGGSPAVGDPVDTTITYVSNSRIAKIKPAAPLLSETEYEIEIPMTIKNSSGQTGSYDEIRTFMVNGSADSEAPTLDSTSPSNGEIDVNVGIPEIYVQFNEALDPVTLNTTNVTVKTTEGGVKVPGKIEYHIWDNSFSFIPQEVLTENTSYTLTLTTAIKDLSGNALASQVTSAFATGDKDITAPEVEYSWSDGWSMGVKFNEHVDQDSIALSNFELNCEGVRKTVSDKSYWYEPWNYELIIEGLNLSGHCEVKANKVKDLSGNLIDPEKKIGSFDVQDVMDKNELNWIMYSVPGAGDPYFAPNTGVIEIGFQNSINKDTLTSEKVKLYPVVDGKFGSEVNISGFDVNSSRTVVYANIPDLQPDAEYALVVSTDILDDYGIPLMKYDPWNKQSNTALDITFHTDAVNDTNSPMVWGTSLDQYLNSIGQPVEVPLSTQVRIQFSKSMNSSTISNSNAAKDGSFIQITKDSSGTAIAGDIIYMSDEQAAYFTPSENLEAGEGYTLHVTTGVKDVMGNPLAEDYTVAFSTTSTADTMAPYLAHAECEEFECRLFFNEALKTTQAENILNYSLKSPTDIAVNLSNKKISYNESDNMVIISDLTLKQDAFFFLTVKNVQDKAGNTIDSTLDDINAERNVDETANSKNEWEGFVWGNYNFYDDKFNKDDMIAGSVDYMFDQFGFGMEAGGFRVEPMNKTKLQEGLWFIDIPIDQVITENSLLQLKFEGDVDVSNVSMPDDCNANPGPSCSPVNSDINGPAPGVLTFSIASKNEASKTVSLKLLGGNTNQYDFLTIDLDGIRNPSTAGNYTVDLTVLKPDKTYAAGPYTSDPYYITGGGNGSIQGTITANGVEDGEEFTLELNSPWSGVSMVTATFNGGTATYSFKYLNDGQYDLMFPSVVTLSGKDFQTPMPPMFFIEGQTKTFDFTLQDLSGDTNSEGKSLYDVTVKVTGAPSLSGKKVTAEVSNWENWYSKDITFNSQGNATAIFRVPAGQYNINAFPYMPKYMAGPPPDMDFMVKDSVYMNVNGVQDKSELNGIDTAVITTTIPDNYINILVKDENNNGVPNADVFCNNPQSPIGGNGGRTGADGTKQLKVTTGDYTCEVFIPGMNNLVKQVSVDASSTKESPAFVPFVVKTGNLHRLSGTVVSGTEKMSNAGVWCDKVDVKGNFLPGWADTMTDGSGNWSVLVDDGYWRCQSEDTDQVTRNVNGVDITGVTLSLPKDTAAITGRILANGSVPNGAVIFAEKVGPDSRFKDTYIEDDGSFTLYLKKEAANYSLSAFIPGVIDKPLAVVSASEDLDLGDIDVTFGAELATLNVNLLAVDGISPFDTREGFVEVNGVNGANYKDFQGTSTSLTMPNGTYSVRVFVKEQGPLHEQTVVINGDTNAQFMLSDNPAVINGKVADSNSQAGIGGALVSISNPQTGYKVDVQTDNQGNYDIAVPGNFTYNVFAKKNGYLMSKVASVAVPLEGTTKNLSLVPSDTGGVHVLGIAYLGQGVNANNNATVVANCKSGESTYSEVDIEGLYDIVLTRDLNTSCILEAFGDGYATSDKNKVTVIPSEDMSGKDIIATPTGEQLTSAKFSVSPEKPLKLSSGAFGITGPSAAFDSSQSSLSITKKEVGKIPKYTKSGAIAGNGFELLASDSSGAVGLSKSITVTVPYPAGMTDEIAVGKASIAYLGNGGWIDVPTTVDTENNLFKFTTDHFTIFGVKTNNDAAAPDAPANLAAVAGEEQVVLDWDDNTDSDLLNYNVYRGTSSGFSASDENQVNTSEVTSSTFTDTTVTGGTKYYYVVTAVDTSLNESSVSGEVNATPTVASGGEEEEEETTTVTTTGGGGSSSSTLTTDNTHFATDDEDESDDEDVEEEEVAEEDVDEEEVEVMPVDSESADEEETATVDENADPLALDTPDYSGHWAESYITNVMDLGIAQGIAENRFDPDSYLTRAQLTKMVVIAAGYDVPSTVETTSFYDVGTSDWYAPYIEVAKSAGLVEGYNEWYFLPNQEINRAEAVKILVESALGRKIALDPSQGMLANFGYEENPFADLDVSEWYAKYVLYAHKYGIITGYADGTLGADNYMTRAEFAKIVSIAMSL